MLKSQTPALALVALKSRAPGLALVALKESDTGAGLGTGLGTGPALAQAQAQAQAVDLRERRRMARQICSPYRWNAAQRSPSFKTARSWLVGAPRGKGAGPRGGGEPGQIDQVLGPRELVLVQVVRERGGGGGAAD